MARPTVFSQIHMGGAVTLRIFASSQSQAEQAAQAAFQRFTEIEQACSDYRPSSEVRRLPRGQWARVSADLWQVLSRSLEMAEATEGAFDPTCGPVVALWRKAREAGVPPDRVAIDQARRQTGFERIRFEDAQAWIPEGTNLDFGGIAKGFACDEAAGAIRSCGVYRFAIQAGGDTVLGDSPPGLGGWEIDIPGGGIHQLLNCAVATSGPSEQPIMIGKKIYSHIVDPRTGLGLEESPTVTVIADYAVIADPLATAFCVLRSAELGAKFGVREVIFAG